MTAIHVEITAEDMGDEQLPTSWAQPVERALARLTGQEVDVDGDGSGCLATIGAGAWTLVIDLPGDVSRWLDKRYCDGKPGRPFNFDLEVPSWVIELVTTKTGHRLPGAPR